MREVISTLSPCLPYLSSSDKEQAYRLLALAHIFRDEYMAADTALSEMLTINPRYEHRLERDPYEFQRALDNYDWYSEFLVSVRIGATYTAPALLRPYTVSTGFSTSPSYSGSIGTDFAIGLQFHISRPISLVLEASYLTSTFSRTSESGYQFSTDYSEVLSQFLFPLAARYEIFIGMTRFFAEAGGYAAFTSSATGSITGIDGITGQTSTTSHILSSDRRTSAAYGTVFGLGAMYPFGPGLLGTNVRYLNGLSDMVKAGTRYSNPDLTYRYFYIDDDFSLRNIEISVAFYLPLNSQSYKLKDTE
jgi:hypothetical protein